MSGTRKFQVIHLFIYLFFASIRSLRPAVPSVRGPPPGGHTVSECALRGCGSDKKGPSNIARVFFLFSVALCSEPSENTFEAGQSFCAEQFQSGRPHPLIFHRPVCTPVSPARVLCDLPLSVRRHRVRQFSCLQVGGPGEPRRICGINCCSDPDGVVGFFLNWKKWMEQLGSAGQIEKLPGPVRVTGAGAFSCTGLTSQPSQWTRWTTSGSGRCSQDAVRMQSGCGASSCRRYCLTRHEFQSRR